MSSPRRIISYFKRPKFALAPEDTRHGSPGENPAPQSSPLTELSSQQLPSDITTPDSPGGPSAQLKRSLLLSAGGQVEIDPALQSSMQSPTTGPVDNDPATQSSFQSSRTGTPFSSSQRIIKNGKVIVTNSDDESDSVGSLEPPEDILSMFLTPAAPKPNTGEDKTKESRGRRAPKSKDVPLWKVAPPKYKNSLDALVIQAVDDNETEAGIARLKASLLAESSRKGGPVSASNLNEDVLASAIKSDGAEDSIGLQRILDAVRRTEALDLRKSWSFFDLETELPRAQEFPRECIRPGTYLAVLRDPDPNSPERERAFHSGVIDFAISKGLLPDEVLRWIFYSISSESRDSLRHAYCRALKVGQVYPVDNSCQELRVSKRTPARRMKSLVRPDDIDTLFWHMGAKPAALALTDPVVPDAHPQDKSPESRPQHHAALLSVLDLFRQAATLFADDTRNRILNYILRLPLDNSLTQDFTTCSAIERTITAVLDATTDEYADELATNICTIFHSTLRDAELQSRLLEHIAPVNDWIAALRRRLAYIFLTDDPSADVGYQDRKTEVSRISSILKHPQYNVKRYKKGQTEYDYGKLTAITTFLDIIIDSGWSETQFADGSAEDEFNHEIDSLADQVKRIFTAIQDSGASHMKRTLAKEALEALHYRIVYCVRTKPRPKKVLFGKYEPEQQRHPSILKYYKKEKKVAIISDKPNS
ncbi:hypothetical protein BDV10DRAFT_186574 [Aspergillus recurvatus]